MQSQNNSLCNLADSEARLILSNLLDGILVVDFYGKILFANRASSNLFKKTEDELMQANFGFPVVPNELQEILILRGGKLCTAQMLGSPILWRGEEAFLISLRDISEKKELENALYRSYQESINASSFQKQLIDSSVEVIIAVDNNFQLLTVNKKYEEFLGKKSADVIGKSLFEVNPKAKYTIQHDSILRALKGETVHLDRRKGIADASIYVDTYFVPLRIQDEIKGVIIMSRDVTEIVKYEEALFRKNIQLKSMNADLESFASLASRELKEPLHRIQSLCELLLDANSNINERAAGYVGRINDSVITMQGFANGLLTYFSIANENVNEKQVVKLSEIIEEAENLIRTFTKTYNVRIVFSDLPDIFVIKQQFVLLFQTLLLNEIQSNDPGVAIDINISHRVFLADDESQKLEIIFGNQVLDTKIKESESEILKLFPQADFKNQNNFFGIGLVLCKKIMDNHGGTFALEEQPTNSLKYVINLPYQKICI